MTVRYVCQSLSQDPQDGSTSSTYRRWRKEKGVRAPTDAQEAVGVPLPLPQPAARDPQPGVRGGPRAAASRAPRRHHRPRHDPGLRRELVLEAVDGAAAREPAGPRRGDGGPVRPQPVRLGQRLPTI